MNITFYYFFVDIITAIITIHLLNLLIPVKKGGSFYGK
jgi:hypothetical protein